MKMPNVKEQVLRTQHESSCYAMCYATCIIHGWLALRLLVYTEDLVCSHMQHADLIVTLAVSRPSGGQNNLGALLCCRGSFVVAASCAASPPPCCA